jgi:HD-GYP domain-containing protein (c-di-GMP phosphodiesterase class II)
MALPAIVLGNEVPEPQRRGDSPQRVIYSPIDLDGLVVDSILDFNLYLPAGPGRFIFFRSPNLPFTIQHRNRLLDRDVRTVYIRADEREQYAKYLEQNIGAVLANPEIPTPKKATLLYSVSKNVIRETFEEPRAHAIMPRARRLATETVEFVLKSERAVVQLASVMATDYYTYTHSINVSVFAVALAHRLGVSRSDIAELATGSLLHDLGKSQIPKDLLTRVGPLSNEEMHTMRGHVSWGERLLTDHGGLSALAMLPVSLHHEKVDGTGYPRRVRAEDLHLFGRIAAIADCFDAMTTNRSYQEALSAYDALHRMKTILRDQYDQALLEKFIRMLRAPQDLLQARKLTHPAGLPS